MDRLASAISLYFPLIPSPFEQKSRAKTFIPNNLVLLFTFIFKTLYKYNTWICFRAQNETYCAKREGSLLTPIIENNGIKTVPLHRLYYIETVQSGDVTRTDPATGVTGVTRHQIWPLIRIGGPEGLFLFFLFCESYYAIMPAISFPIAHSTLRILHTKCMHSCPDG